MFFKFGDATISHFPDLAPEDHVVLPPNLQTLTFGYCFKQRLENVPWQISAETGPNHTDLGDRSLTAETSRVSHSVMEKSDENELHYH